MVWFSRAIATLCAGGVLAAGLAPTWSAAADVEYEQGKAVIAAFLRAGVQHVVYTGLEDVAALTDGALKVPPFDGKARIERAIAASGLHYTFLHLSSYCENFVQVVANDGRELDLNLPCPRVDADGNLVLLLPLEDKAMRLFCVGDLGQAVVTVLQNPSVVRCECCACWGFVNHEDGLA